MDLGALIGRQVVQRVTDLRFNEAALFLDHQDRTLAAGECAQALGLQRPGHRHLVERDLRVALQIEHAQRMHRIGVRAPDGDDADRRIVAPNMRRSSRLARAHASAAGMRSCTTRRSSSARSAGKRMRGS